MTIKYVNTIEDNNITIDAIKNHLNKISTEKLSYIQKEKLLIQKLFLKYLEDILHQNI